MEAAVEAAGVGDVGAAGAEVFVAAGVVFADGAAALAGAAAGAGVEAVAAAGLEAFAVADFFELRDFLVVEAESVVAFASVAGAAPDVPLAAVAPSEDADFFDLVELFLDVAVVDLSAEAAEVESAVAASDFFDFDFELAAEDESVVEVADDWVESPAAAFFLDLGFGLLALASV